MRILIMREGGGLGDAITIQAAIAGLREKHADAEITWLLPAELQPVFRLDPHVNKWLPSPPHTRRHFSTHRERSAVKHDVRFDEYDLVIDEWCPCWRYEHSVGMDVRKSRIDNFCDEAGVAPRQPRLYVSDSDVAAAAEVVRRLQRPRVVIQWHSANQGKDYPRERVSAVATALEARGASVIFIGRTLFAGDPKHATNLANPNYRLLMGICADADLVVGPDSGVLHMAAALSRPTLWLFGPTNPVSTCRYYPEAEWLWAPAALGCEPPCYYAKHRGFKCPRRAGDCMASIPAEAVLRVAERMIDFREAARWNEEHNLGQEMYRHFLALGIDYAMYGSWQTAYGEFLEHVFGIRGKSVLDIGSACGAIVRAMVERGANAWGVEPDLWMATHPVQGLSGRVRHGYLDAHVPSGLFDLVHASQVLEHISEPAIPETLFHAARGLKAGGMAVAALPFEGDEDATRDSTHVTLKPREWWNRRFAEAGLVDVLTEYSAAIAAEPMQRQHKWNWLVFRKPERSDT